MAIKDPVHSYERQGEFWIVRVIYVASRLSFRILCDVRDIDIIHTHFPSKHTRQQQFVQPLRMLDI